MGRGASKEKEVREKEQNVEHSFSSAESGGEGDNETITAIPPVILTTGEKKISDHHAKLYRFESDSQTWKEKGRGRIHILQSAEEKDGCRVVMWVDRTGKIACNFRLFPEFKIKDDPTNPTTAVHWRSFDLSDAETPKWETFACKFRSEEECNDFKTTLMRYVLLQPQPSRPAEDTDGGDCDGSNGCIGCDPDTFEFPQQIDIKIESVIIDHKLDLDSCTERPTLVDASMFN